MKILITLDHLDGTTAVRGPYHPDEIDLTGLLFYLNRKGIAGVTFTNAEPLKDLIKRKDQDAL